MNIEIVDTEGSFDFIAWLMRNAHRSVLEINNKTKPKRIEWFGWQYFDRGLSWEMHIQNT